LYRRGGGSDIAICAVAGTATQSNARRITKGIAGDTIVLGNAVGSRVLGCLVKEEMDEGFERESLSDVTMEDGSADPIFKEVSRLILFKVAPQ